MDAYFQNVLNKARRFCAYQERYHQQLRDKLYEWKLHKKEVEEIISCMIEEGYLNEERFATAYAGGKFRVNEWGRIKIKSSLLQKKISDYCIRKAMNEINDREYKQTLKKIIDSKLKTISEKNPLKKNHKAAQFAISRGFEPDLVWGVIGKLAD